MTPTHTKTLDANGLCRHIHACLAANKPIVFLSDTVEEAQTVLAWMQSQFLEVSHEPRAEDYTIDVNGTVKGMGRFTARIDYGMNSEEETPNMPVPTPNPMDPGTTAAALVASSIHKGHHVGHMAKDLKEFETVIDYIRTYYTRVAVSGLDMKGACRVSGIHNGQAFVVDVYQPPKPPEFNGEGYTKPKEFIRDADLIALAALASCEAVVMAGENASRAMHGQSPAFDTGGRMMPAGETLRVELHRRGYKV